MICKKCGIGYIKEKKFQEGFMLNVLKQLKKDNIDYFQNPNKPYNIDEVIDIGIKRKFMEFKCRTDSYVENKTQVKFQPNQMKAMSNKSIDIIAIIRDHTIHPHHQLITKDNFDNIVNDKGRIKTNISESFISYEELHKKVIEWLKS